jgi:hypothetical protein
VTGFASPDLEVAAASVISGPYDVPGTGLRQAAIVDPQGTPLSLTQPPGLA